MGLNGIPRRNPLKLIAHTGFLLFFENRSREALRVKETFRLSSEDQDLPAQMIDFLASGI